MDPYIGEVRLFAGNFAPRGWALCQGQIIPVQQNVALFSLLGTNYGGNGTTTFGLPNLMGTAAVSQGSGPGLTPRAVGEVGGSANVSLITPEIPLHTHFPSATVNVATSKLVTSPAGANWAYSATGTPIYATAPIDTPMYPLALSMAGGSQPHNNMQPFVAINYIIALEGIFPSRP